MALSNDLLSSIHVVARKHLPSEPPPNPGNADEKPFHGHELIRRLLPDARSLSMSWIGARFGETVVVRSKPTPTLLLVLGGAGRLIGYTSRTVTEGDVITIPAGHEYGFDEVARRGLESLEIAFGSASGSEQAANSSGQAASTLTDLLARNDELTKHALEHPVFQLLHDGTFDDPEKRSRFFDVLQVFSDAFQTILLARQAVCKDERFVSVFSTHWREELGHNELLSRGRIASRVNDPVLNALVSWFCRQMFVLDNVEKVVLMHLVLEAAGHHFHTIGQRVFKGDKVAAYFEAHSEADDRHSNLANHLLVGLSSTTYARLINVLESSWAMFEALVNRIVKLTKSESLS